MKWHPVVGSRLHTREIYLAPLDSPPSPDVCPLIFFSPVPQMCIIPFETPSPVATCCSISCYQSMCHLIPPGPQMCTT